MLASAGCFFWLVGVILYSIKRNIKWLLALPLIFVALYLLKLHFSWAILFTVAIAALLPFLEPKKNRTLPLLASIAALLFFIMGHALFFLHRGTGDLWENLFVVYVLICLSVWLSALSTFLLAIKRWKLNKQARIEPSVAPS